MNDTRPLGVRTVLLASGMLGFFIGYAHGGTWQAAVETAQVLAGLVTYPKGNPFGVYHLKAWSLANQVLAVPLALNVRELPLSLFVSGALGMLSFQGLALAAWVLCRSLWWSLAAPLIMLGLFGLGEQYGLVYPVLMLGSFHTYGILARGWALLTLGVLASGRRRTGLFMLGIAPAVHPTWGAWTWAVAFAVLAWERPPVRDALHRWAPCFAAGFAVTLASMAVQWAFGHGAAPDAPHEELAKYVAAFYSHWDWHRRPVALLQPGMYVALASLALSLAWLVRWPQDLSAHGRFLLRAVVVSTCAGVVLCMATHFHAVLPPFVNAVMPGRFLNLSVLVFPAVLLGLLGRHRRKPAFSALTSLHVGYVFWAWFFMHRLASDRFGWSLAHWKEFVACTVALMACRWFVGSRCEPSGESRRPRILAKAPVALIAALTLFVLLGMGLNAGRFHVSLADRTNNPVFSAASERPGLLLTASDMQIVQLRTRRPLLLNGGALDQLPYVPSTGPAMAHILDGVYGIDILNPTDDIRSARTGALVRNSGKALWEERTPKEWERVAREFGVTDVLAYADWRLDLPVVAQDDAHILYALPQVE